MKITGLNNLNRLIIKLDKLDAFVQTQTDNIIGKNKKILEDDNRKQLTFAGIGSDGAELAYIGNRTSPLDNPYTKAYAKYKDKRGGQTTFVDLRLTGDFHKSIVLLQDNPGLWTFRSEDEKFPWLINMYGDKILGVTEEFLQEFADDTLQPQLQSKVDNFVN